VRLFWSARMTMTMELCTGCVRCSSRANGPGVTGPIQPTRSTEFQVGCAHRPICVGRSNGVGLVFR
jgi:hypothetical protein